MARVAAIDCGTNSIRLLVADVTKREDGTAWLRDVHREMKIVRLGQGVDATGRLHPDAIERTRQALLDYARTMQRKGVESRAHGGDERDAGREQPRRVLRHDRGDPRRAG